MENTARQSATLWPRDWRAARLRYITKVRGPAPSSRTEQDSSKIEKKTETAARLRTKTKLRPTGSGIT
eukprot:6130614-Pyramimonas_sp.AAC.1